MKIKTIFTASVLLPGLALAAVNSPLSGKGLYLKAEAGLSRPWITRGYQVEQADKQIETIKLSKALKNAFVGGLGVGYTVNKFIRTDLMFDYRRFHAKEKDPAKARLYTGTLSAYFDWQNPTVVTPYVTGGLGVARDHRTLPKDIKSNKTHFIWQAGAGIYFKVTQHVSLDLATKYFSMKVDKLGGMQAYVGANEFLLGLVYKC